MDWRDKAMLSRIPNGLKLITDQIITKTFDFCPNKFQSWLSSANRNKQGAPIDKLWTLLKHWGKLKLEGMSNRGGLEIGLTCNRKTTWRLNIKTAAGESDAVEIFVQTINNQHGHGLPWKTIRHQIPFLENEKGMNFSN